MYFQPYGDEQQLNLNWIINEIINLHKQLDPDYETPSFTQVYPYSNLNRLNLDWILSELKALKELAPEPSPELDIQAVAVALVALPFDSNTSYQIYDFISRDGEIWRATEPIAAGGVWDETKWFKTKIGTDLAVLERWINAINNSLTSLQNTVADLSSIDISDDSDAGGATVKASLNLLKGSLNSLTKKFPTSGDSVADIINNAISAGYGQPFVQPVATGVGSVLSGGIGQSACYGFFNYIQPANRVDYALFNPFSGIIATGYINAINSAVTVTSNNTTQLFTSSTSAWGSGDTLTFTLPQANRTAYHFVGFGFASEFEEAYIKIRTDGIVVKKLNGDATYTYEDGNLIITLPNTSYWSYKLEKLLMLPL